MAMRSPLPAPALGVLLTELCSANKGNGSLHVRTLAGLDTPFVVTTRVHNGYTDRMATKDVAFKLRIDEELRRNFVQTCQAEDRPAAQVVRQFMRAYVAARQSTPQAARSPQPGTTTEETKQEQGQGV